MKHSDKLTEVLAEGCMVRLVEDDIYSVLPDVPHKHLYDRRAAAYDSVVSTWLYNRVMWEPPRSTTSPLPAKPSSPILLGEYWMLAVARCFLPRKFILVRIG